MQVGWAVQSSRANIVLNERCPFEDENEKETNDDDDYNGGADDEYENTDDHEYAFFCAKTK